MQSIEKLFQIASDICLREGCKLYDLEFLPGSRGQGRKLLVYVDKAGGVSLEDCEKVSRGMSLILDVEEVIDGEEYVLEVSSPGIEKPLKEKWHFEEAIGSQVYVHSLDSIIPENEKGIKRFKVTGKLSEVKNDSLVVLAEGQEFLIPISGVKKAHVVFDFESLKQKKKQN